MTVKIQIDPWLLPKRNNQMTRCRDFLSLGVAKKSSTWAKGATTNIQHLPKAAGLSLTAYRNQIPQTVSNTNTQMTHDTTIRHNERMME
jgi:hypothetical protein